MKINKLIILGMLLIVLPNSAYSDQSELDKVKIELATVKKILDAEKKSSTSLQKKLKECNEQYKHILISPEQGLLRGRKATSKKEYQEAINEYQKVINDYPDTKEEKVAKSAIKKINDKLEKIAKEEARKKAQGFKALKNNFKVKIKNVSMNFQKIRIKKSWTFDSHGSEYYYRKAEKNSKFVEITVNISSKDKNPNLPVLASYEVVDGKLKRINDFDYKFRRWSDYASYLGNDKDFKNDFAYTSTIPFKLGVQVTNESIKRSPIFIVASKKHFADRHQAKYNNPPVMYFSLEHPKDILTLEDFEKDYILIKIINRKKL